MSPKMLEIAITGIIISNFYGGECPRIPLKTPDFWAFIYACDLLIYGITVTHFVYVKEFVENKKTAKW